MKTYTIEIDETVGEFFEEVATIIGNPVEAVIRDVLFNHAEVYRGVLLEAFTVEGDE